MKILRFETHKMYERINEEHIMLKIYLGDPTKTIAIYGLYNHVSSQTLQTIPV